MSVPAVFFNDAAHTEIYTLSLHDALPIYLRRDLLLVPEDVRTDDERAAGENPRSEEHTSELQSLRHLVCRLLLEKKKAKTVRGIGLYVIRFGHFISGDPKFVVRYSR